MSRRVKNQQKKKKLQKLLRSEEQQEEILKEVTLDKNITEQKKRDFMKQMRNLDKKMFNYPKSTDFNSYSQTCPAVDDRQPLILSKTQFKKVEEKSKEWIEENKGAVLEWGSSKETKKYYICARLFCVKCMLPLTLNQLLKKSGKESGTCPECGVQ